MSQHIMGWRVPDAAVPFIRAGRQHPAVLMVGGTVAIVSVLQWRHTSRTHRRMVASQQTVTQLIESTVSDCRGSLRSVDMTYTRDIKQKDELIRNLQLQNVEQTRSVDRLNLALKACTPLISEPVVSEPPRVPPQSVPVEQTYASSAPVSQVSPAESAASAPVANASQNSA